MARFPFEEWRVEGIRLTAFPVLGEWHAQDDWFDVAVGSAADEVNHNSKKSTWDMSHQAESGLRSQLHIEPSRIDWRFGPPEVELEQVGQLNDVPALGAFESAFGACSLIVERWLVRSDVPELARIALGVVVRRPVASKAAGYALVPDFIPATPPQNSSDFMFQINIPVQSSTGIEGLVINRLTKWSVSVFRRLQLTFAGGAVPTHASDVPLTFSFRLELDVNTAADFPVGRLPRERLVDIYREFVARTREIATSGLGQR
jgi:hypothetical protein